MLSPPREIVFLFGKMKPFTMKVSIGGHHMDTVNVLLCCAGGMSSGFLASSMRKAAKKKGISAHVEAVAESNVGQMIQSYDLLMVGPHYASQLENFQKICSNHNVPVVVIPQSIYGMLDGQGAMDLALETIENYQK